jgi:predicted nucleotidyltransferase
MTRIEKTISDYFKNQNEVIAVYLFGSYAADKQRTASDIDIGLIADYDAIQIFAGKKDRYVADLARKLRKDIHLVLLNNSSEVLHAQVFGKGKCLRVNKPRELAVYKMRMFARIAEFGYYKNIMQAGFVRKVMETGSKI